MKALTCALVTLGLVAAAYAATPAELKTAQDVTDAFLKAIADKDFDKYKENVSSKRLAEYMANEINNPIKRWWDAAREEIEKHNAKWVFDSVKTNMPNTIGLNYKRTLDTGETINYIELVKEGDKWLVDAAGSI